MRLPFFGGGGGRGRGGGGGGRALRLLRRPVVKTRASASSDHVRRKTERAKRREETGSWKEPEQPGFHAKIFAHASQADLQRRIALKVSRYSSASVAAETPHAKLPSDFAWRMCSDDEEETDFWALSSSLFSWDGDY